MPLLSACAGGSRGEAPAARSGEGFAFGIVGDIPYSRVQEAEYDRVIAEMNARELAFVDALIAEMQGYSKPVLYMHGDTHIYRTGKPLLNPKTQRFFENLTRLETFGWPDSAWVRVVVNPSNRELFEIHPEYAPANSSNFPAG